MSKFKVGQQVRVVVDDSEIFADPPPKGAVGEVMYITSVGDYSVNFEDFAPDTFAYFEYEYGEDELEAVE